MVFNQNYANCESILNFQFQCTRCAAHADDARICIENGKLTFYWFNAGKCDFSWFNYF